MVSFYFKKWYQFSSGRKGIDNVDENSIESVYIYHNNSLSTCDVESMCNFAVVYGYQMYVYNNAEGCNSENEIIDACGLSVDETATPESHITLAPNPASTSITISLPSTTPQKNTTLTIYNINGQAIISRQIAEQQMLVDVSGLPPGIYLVKVSNERTVIVDKIVKNN